MLMRIEEKLRRQPSIHVCTMAAAFAAAILVAAGVPGTARAAEQSRAELKCFKKVTGTAKKVPITAFKEAGKCIKDETAGKLSEDLDAQQCLKADRKGKIAKARFKINTSANVACAHGNKPKFGLAPASNLTDARLLPVKGLVADVWGFDLQEALDAVEEHDYKGKCAVTMLKGISKSFVRADKAFTKCVANGLKHKDDPITGDQGIIDCLEVVTGAESAKLAKDFQKLRIKLGKKCLGVGLDEFFPGLETVCEGYGEDATTMGGLVACGQKRINCRVCKQAEDVHEVETNCSLFDDGIDAGQLEGSCPICGNGVVDPGEDCDDGNNMDGDCCNSLCQFEEAQTFCDGPSSQCTAAMCDGAGSCTEQPYWEGDPCDDDYECSRTSICEAGECVADKYLLTGSACLFSVVGGTTVDTRLETARDAWMAGDICADWGDFGIGTTISTSESPADIMFTSFSPQTGWAAQFRPGNVASGGDVLTNRQSVRSIQGAYLPGSSVKSLGPGLVLQKTPLPTVYDTTGEDPRMGECIAAQLGLEESEANIQDLDLTIDFGAMLEGVPPYETRTMRAPYPGEVNVIDVSMITPMHGSTIEFHGGHDPNTVMVIRVHGSIQTAPEVHVSAVGGLKAVNLLIYSGVESGTYQGGCDIGNNNIGEGTLYCPNSRIRLNHDTAWQGQILGGSGGENGGILLERRVRLTPAPYSGY